MTRVLVIDDQPLIGRGIKATLANEPDIEVTRQACSAGEALDWLRTHSVDIVVSEILMPDMRGPALIENLLLIRPEARVVNVTGCDDAFCAERALQAGARGYVLKSEVCDTIARAIRRVAAGGYFISDPVLEQFISAIARSDTKLIPSPHELLSEQELHVFEATGTGLNAREIAEQMSLSVKTVESYRNRIKAKMGLKTLGDLVQEAVKWNQSKGPCRSWPPGASEDTVESGDGAADMKRIVLGRVFTA